MELNDKNLNYLKLLSQFLLLSAGLAIILVFIIGRPGCNDGSAFSVCTPWIFAYIIYFVLSSVISLVSLSVYYLSNQKFSGKKPVFFALISILVGIGILTVAGMDGSQNNQSNLESACKATIDAKCAAKSDIAAINAPKACIKNQEIQNDWLPEGAEAEGDKIICSKK